jgi:hypothetical protein
MPEMACTIKSQPLVQATLHNAAHGFKSSRHVSDGLSMKARPSVQATLYNAAHGYKSPVQSCTRLQASRSIAPRHVKGGLCTMRHKASSLPYKGLCFSVDMLAMVVPKVSVDTQLARSGDLLQDGVDKRSSVSLVSSACHM